jgi:hypothetical protein
LCFSFLSVKSLSLFSLKISSEDSPSDSSEDSSEDFSDDFSISLLSDSKLLMAVSTSPKTSSGSSSRSLVARDAQLTCC